MNIKFPLNVSSVTFATAGTLVPDAAGVVTGVGADEGTQVVQRYNKPIVVSTATNGDTVLRVPAQITSMTVNGNVRAVTNGIVAAMSALDATTFLSQLQSRQAFTLVTG